MHSEEATLGPRRQKLGRRTCLFCYRAFRIERGEAPCPNCGASQSKAQQELFWTLDPLWRRRQTIARIAGLLATLGLGLFLAVQVGNDGSALFWGLGLLGLTGVFLWETAGLLTRRDSALPLRILWPAVLLCVAFGPILFSVLLHFIGGQGDAAMRWQVGLLWAVPWLVPFAFSLWIPGWLRRQREACLRAGEGS